MFEKILVAVDGSINSDRAVAAGAEMARVHDSPLTICHAFHIPEQYKTDLVDELEEALVGDAEKILSHAAGVAEATGITPEVRLLKKGHPTEAIVSYAKELGVDVIVVGVRGKTPGSSRAIGSVSSAVAEQAGCSVLLVRVSQ
jgi:nucleotide-binding universal stress UspA family protein